MKAIAEAPSPKNQSGVRSFFGLCTILHQVHTTVCHCICTSLGSDQKNAKWRWGTKEEATFLRIKCLLTPAPVMAYYNQLQHAETRVTTDASPVGLGAILQQVQPDSQFRSVYYASRKLSKTEQRYSQLERKALAMK